MSSRKLSGWVDEDDYYDDFDDGDDDGDEYDDDYYYPTEHRHSATTTKTQKKTLTKTEHSHSATKTKTKTSLEKLSNLALNPENEGSYVPSNAERMAYENTHKLDLCLVILGHVDAGKSTLCGRLLEALHSLDERTHQKI